MERQRHLEDTGVADQAGNRRMMMGYLDSTSTSTTTVAVAGLPSAVYDVYVYADGDNRSYARTASYTISGAGITTSVDDAHRRREHDLLRHLRPLPAAATATT